MTYTIHVLHDKYLLVKDQSMLLMYNVFYLWNSNMEAKSLRHSQNAPANMCHQHHSCTGLHRKSISLRRKLIKMCT